jgi:lipopolysaccharide export system protein LptC
VNETTQIPAPSGPAPRASSRAYREARRHSARVRFLRRVIPLGAAIAIGCVGFVALFDPFSRVGGVTLGPVSLTGTKITMEAPRLTGYRDGTRPYEVTATAALQDVRKPTLIELKEMKGRLALDDAGGLAHLEAISGLFDTQKEQLELREGVYVRTESGQEARLRSASIDFKAGTLASKEPVKVTLPNGTVEADALDLTDNGKVISFIGKVTAVLQPGDEPSRVESKAAPAADKPARTSQAAQAAPPIETTGLRP